MVLTCLWVVGKGSSTLMLCPMHIHCLQSLLDQTSNRKLKKDRKKDIKHMEEKVHKQA